MSMPRINHASERRPEPLEARMGGGGGDIRTGAGGGCMRTRAGAVAGAGGGVGVFVTGVGGI